MMPTMCGWPVHMPVAAAVMCTVAFVLLYIKSVYAEQRPSVPASKDILLL